MGVLNTKTTPCHILRLPPELRLHIYDHLFGQKTHLSVYVLDDVYIDSESKTSQVCSDAIALLRTCKLIHAEASPIFYDAVTLRIWLEDGKTPHMRIKCVGPATAWTTLQHFKTVEIYVWAGLEAVPRNTLSKRLGRLVGCLDQGRGLKSLLIEFKQLRSEQKLGGLKKVPRRVECGGELKVRIGNVLGRTAGNKAELLEMVGVARNAQSGSRISDPDLHPFIVKAGDNIFHTYLSTFIGVGTFHTTRYAGDYDMEAEHDQDPPCYLLELPPEMRLVVYSHLFSGPYTFQIDVADKVYVYRQGRGRKRDYGTAEPDRGVQSLLRTCKVTHAEASPVFYDNIILNVNLFDSKQTLRPILAVQCLGQPSIHRLRRGIKHVELELWSIDVSATAGAMPERLAAFFNAIEHGARLKTSSITLWLFQDEILLEKLCDGFRNITSKGKITVHHRRGLQKAAMVMNGMSKVVQSIGGQVLLSSGLVA